MLKIENLTVNISNHNILNNINLELLDGERLAIIGSNGAGKSTLFNSIIGNLNVDGNIYLNNEKIENIPLYKKSDKIGILYQNPSLSLSSNMSIYQNYILCLKNKNNIKENLSLLNLNLENRLKIKVKNLSGGERQALALLLTILRQPKLLLLDEHTAALDPKMSKYIMELTVSLTEKYQISTLLITHDFDIARNYANRIYDLNKKEIVDKI